MEKASADLGSDFIFAEGSAANLDPCSCFANKDGAVRVDTLFVEPTPKAIEEDDCFILKPIFIAIKGFEAWANLNPEGFVG